MEVRFSGSWGDPVSKAVLQRQFLGASIHCKKTQLYILLHPLPPDFLDVAQIVVQRLSEQEMNGLVSKNFMTRNDLTFHSGLILTALISTHVGMLVCKLYIKLLDTK